MSIKTFLQRLKIFLWYQLSTKNPQDYEKPVKKKIIQLLNNGWSIFNLPEYLVSDFFNENLNEDILKKIKIIN